MIQFDGAQIFKMGGKKKHQLLGGSSQLVNG